MTRETTQRARSLRTIVAPLIAMTLVMAACGSDDAAEPAAEPAAEAPAAEPAAEPTGEPLKVMTVTTLNAAGPTYQNIANTAIAYQDYINARGGIAGRQLEVTVCDEQFDPAIATTCAREAVEEDMVSIVGSFTYFAESIVPVIAESSITWFGACCQLHRPNSAVPTRLISATSRCMRSEWWNGPYRTVVRASTPSSSMALRCSSRRWRTPSKRLV